MGSIGFLVLAAVLAIGTVSSGVVPGVKVQRSIDAGLGDPEADNVVDAALAVVIATLEGEDSVDPAVSESMLGIEASGDISGLTDIARTQEANFVNNEGRTELQFQFGINNVVLTASITSDTDTTVDGLGVAQVEEVIVDVTATQNDDGTYDVTSYDVSPIDNVNVILTNLGSLESISDDITTMLWELTVEAISVAVSGPIQTALEDTL